MLKEDGKLSKSIDERTDKILATAAKLKADIAAARLELQRTRKSLSQRKSQNASTQSSNIEPKERKRLEDVQKSTKMTTYKWNQLHTSAMTARSFLCAEAARLYGLQRVLTPDSTTFSYSISSIPIYDLRAMCAKAKPSEITASLTQISQLLVLATHYLAIKLPAEITLPHRDYPLPTIFKPRDSYKSNDSRFPGYPNKSNSTSDSPSSSRHDDTSRGPSPRPLYINKPLPTLHKEDVIMFLEGVSYLAYDIAWACKTQSCVVGTSAENAPTTVEDVCDIGGNLHRLLVTKTTSSRRTATRLATAQQAGHGTDTGDSEDNRSTSSSTLPLGHFSHGMAHDFLGSKDGMEYQKAFKLPSTTAINDYLRTHTMSEIEGTGWTLVEDDAATVEDEIVDDHDGVLVNGGTGKAYAQAKRDRKGSKERKAERESMLRDERRALSDFGAASFMSVQTVAATTAGPDEGDAKRGKKGWTLVKDRTPVGT